MTTILRSDADQLLKRLGYKMAPEWDSLRVMGKLREIRSKPKLLAGARLGSKSRITLQTVLDSENPDDIDVEGY